MLDLRAVFDRICCALQQRLTDTRRNSGHRPQRLHTVRPSTWHGAARCPCRETARHQPYRPCRSTIFTRRRTDRVAPPGRRRHAPAWARSECGTISARSQFGAQTWDRTVTLWCEDTDPHLIVYGAIQKSP